MRLVFVCEKEMEEKGESWIDEIDGLIVKIENKRFLNFYNEIKDLDCVSDELDKFRGEYYDINELISCDNVNEIINEKLIDFDSIECEEEVEEINLSIMAGCIDDRNLFNMLNDDDLMFIIYK